MFNAHLTHSNGHPLTKNVFQTFVLAVSLVLMSVGLHLNTAFAVPSEPEIVDVVTIQHQGKGIVPSYTLPIYQVGEVRFLSAGVGIEERQATYPPFPLKLIFAQTGGAFLSGVSVSIKDQAGKELANISEDQTAGPWLFLDLAPGLYNITAVRKDGTTIHKTIKAPKGKSKDIYLHWPTPKG